jgi:hypothetical protein
VVRRVFFWAFCLLVLYSASAKAEPRIALVVGNGAYQAVSSLENPARDATLMAETLRGLDFQVTLLTDASLADLRTGFAEFGRSLREAGPEATGLFYYAGHGVQSFGSNYLLPVDAAPTDAADLDLVAIEAQSVLRQMASARNRANIVILDACRNNPFASIPDMNDNGLAEMKAPTGTFLAYATEPGSVALDGSDGNSPFTQALASEMTRPGVALEQMFKQVRVAVLEATGGLQTPWDTSSMTVDFTFKAAGEVDLGEEQLWASVSESRDPVQIMLFMRAYPEGKRAAEAKALLAEVMAAELSGAPEPEPEPVATGPEEQAAFEAAQAQPSVETWETFIAQHPDSVFRELAETELAALVEKSGTDPVANPPADQPVFGDLFFDQPLTAGGPDVEGRSIAEIIQTSPLFPPIEGLPDEVWKGKHCKDCHSWTQPALCDQGKFYVNSGEPMELGAIHPYGGQLRRVLKAWAEQGCR